MISQDPSRQPLDHSSEITDHELEVALETAETCFRSWFRKSPSERAAVIAKAAEILRARGDEFAGPATLEMGSLIDQARREVALSADVIEYYAKNAEALGHSRTDPAAVESNQFGIVIGNHSGLFPYFQLARLAAPNLMAGNVVVMKYAGSVPPCALAFEKLWLEAGAPAGTYTNLLITREQAERLVADPRLRYVAKGGMDAVDCTARAEGRHPSPAASARASAGSPALCNACFV
ncbi:aldehyde dehydrogenase family protein [bacterium]|nr:aldehyde dehydrogenase family protein [bacterium]